MLPARYSTAVHMAQERSVVDASRLVMNAEGAYTEAFGPHRRQALLVREMQAILLAAQQNSACHMLKVFSNAINLHLFVHLCLEKHLPAHLP